MLTKYGPLFQYLNNLAKDYWEASFADIERILAFPLPKSARDHQAWWSGKKAGTHIQKKAWLDAGWKVVSVDLAKGLISFQRVGGKASVRHEMAASVVSDIVKNQSSKLIVHWAWQYIGTVSMTAEQQLKFPSVPASPGVYRFIIHGSTGARTYIGESENLQRRFHTNYRYAGKSQKTSIRINQEFKAALANTDTRVDVYVVVDGRLALDRELRPINLHNKDERRLLEQAIIVDHGGELLNR